VTIMMDPVPSMVVRGALSLLFLWAASHKLRDLTGFQAALAGYELVPRSLQLPVAAALATLEAAIAVGLWLPTIGVLVSWAAAGTLLLYAGAISVNLLRGRHDNDCGCAGPVGRQPISAGLVVRNLVLAVGALLTALPVAPRTPSWIDVVTVTAGVTASAFLYAAADGLLAHAPRLAKLERRRREVVHA
jgi:hypothetical protein